MVNLLAPLKMATRFYLMSEIWARRQQWPLQLTEKLSQVADGLGDLLIEQDEDEIADVDDIVASHQVCWHITFHVKVT